MFNFTPASTRAYLLIYLLTVALACLTARAETATEMVLSNPESTLRFSLQMEKGVATYRVDRIEANNATVVLEPSPLGLNRTDASFDRELSLLSVSPVRMINEAYALVAGKQRQVKSRASERTFTFRNASDMILTITARAYRDGVAFRYGLPGEGTQRLYISDESTGFNLPEQTRVWTQPYSKVDTWSPSYESEYVNGIAAGTPSPDELGWCFPLVFQTGDTWGLITESDLDSTYFASHLQNAPNGLYRVRLPEDAETYGVAPRNATVTLPWVSPWRVIVIGRSAGALAESTLITDVARPSEIKDTAWIKPGVASWSWWSDMSSPREYAKLTPFIDASSKFHWPYSLLDLGWEAMEASDIKKLIAYASAKKVGLFAWYNSAGRHNYPPGQRPEGAGLMDRLNDPASRNAEFARIAAIGFKGIKVDFMQSDKQFVIGLYLDILRDAARHKLLVNFHGATIPRGWERTFPNLIAIEAVRGAEQYWDEKFAENAQAFHTIYVFTRNAVGPMDYTPTVFTHPGSTNPKLQRHLTTNTHELALLVVFQSGVQHVIDPATSLMQQPAFVQEYLTDLPTAWDESRVLAGSPGELAVIARRSGRTWYIAGINGLKTPQSLQVPLSFLERGNYILSLITDGATPAEFTHAVRSSHNKDQLEVVLAGRGGFAARLTHD